MHPRQRPFLALIFRLISAFCFASMFLVIKLLGERHVPLAEIMFWRQFTCVPLLLIGLAIAGKLGELRSERRGAHAARSILGTTNMTFVLGSAILLPLAESTTLGFSSALWAVVISAMVLHERVGPWRWTAVLLGFAGVVIVAQPSGEPINPLGAAIAMIGAMISAVINFQIRDLGRTESAACVVFWFSAIGSLMVLPFMLHFRQPHDSVVWAMLLFSGCLGFTAQMFMTAALRLGAVENLLVMDYTSLIWATLYGWLFWDKLPPAATWLGAPLIVAAGIVIAWREARLRRQGSAENQQT